MTQDRDARPGKTHGVSLSVDEISRLREACIVLPPASQDYRINDLVDNLLLTVLDFQMNTTTVVRAMDHFARNCRESVRSIDELLRTMDRWPDDRDGNLALARHLWGYNLWTRAGMLRGLARYFESRGIGTQADLVRWAETSEFQRDFAGQVKGLGPAVYNWLVMRQGVETIKPDVHVLRFVSTLVERSIPAEVAVEVLTRIAGELGLKAYELDWRIWEYQRQPAPSPEPRR